MLVWPSSVAANASASPLGNGIAAFSSCPKSEGDSQPAQKLWRGGMGVPFSNGTDMGIVEGLEGRARFLQLALSLYKSGSGQDAWRILFPLATSVNSRLRRLPPAQVTRIGSD